jgi:acetylornithine deacetylase
MSLYVLRFTLYAVEVMMSQLQELLARLVAIDSRNPALVPDGPGETAIAGLVADFLGAAGLEVTLVEPQPGRPSAIGRLAGVGGGRNLLLNAHTDTVGFGAMIGPLTPRVEGGRMYGRGAYDMKSGLAAVLVAAAELARGPRLRGDLIVTVVADEEHSSLGTEAAIAHLRAIGAHADGAIITEPTDMQLCLAHRGFAWATITTHGRAAHGSLRADGIDAIAHMGRVLVALEQFDRDLQTRPAHPLLEAGILHASLIEGGTELSTYPARCVLQVERRTLPGETAESVAGELEAVLEQLRAADPQFSAEVELTLFRAPMETDATERIARVLAGAAEALLGTPPAVIGATGWMDSALLDAAGIPTAIFGPRGDGAHADVEWVELASVRACTDVLVAAAREFCEVA